MSSRPVIDARPELDARLGEFSPSLFDDRFYRSWELVNRYALEWTVRLGHQLGLVAALSEPVTAEEMRARLGFRPDFTPALESVLRRLSEMGEIESNVRGGEDEYRLHDSLREPDLASVRERCLANDESNRPALDILDAAGSVYLDVATGRTSGREALFGLGQTQLWLDYFDNENPTYAINNLLAAAAAARRISPTDGLRILEVGGGAGSGTVALLQAFETAEALDHVLHYRFTEPSPFFRRRAERTLAERFETVPFEFSSVDIDVPLPEQGIERESFDLVYGVNVLHVAEDLVATLRELRESLRPGGWLVAGECIRPVPRMAVSTEFVFLLLETYREVELDPELRPEPGFLAPRHWGRLLQRSGYDPIQVVPDHAAIHEVYPHFFAGVVCGRRPAS